MKPMKSMLAAALLAGAALFAAPAAQAAPAFSPATPLLHGGHHHHRGGSWGGVGIGIGVGGGYVAPRPYWGITGYTTQARTVVVGHDAHGHAITSTRYVSVPVYGWVYPAAAYRPYVYPSVSMGFGYRW